MIDKIDRAERVLELLQFGLGSEFVQCVETLLRRLSDQEINTLYLMTCTGPNMGDHANVWTAVLIPVIEEEWELRREIALVPRIGPTIAPDLYRKGGGHHVPF
jgi:hypothetical protein